MPEDAAVIRASTQRQKEITPNSTSRIIMLSGTPSSHRMIGIVAS
jgi:hypothetical protein